MSAVLAPTDIREQAAQRFEQLGWPTPRLEEWKFTNLAPLQREKWNRAQTGMSGPQVAQTFLSGRAFTELRFINGIFAPEHSTNADAFAMSAETRAQHYARYAD